MITSACTRAATASIIAAANMAARTNAIVGGIVWAPLSKTGLNAADAMASSLPAEDTGCAATNDARAHKHSARRRTKDGVSAPALMPSSDRRRAAVHQSAQLISMTFRSESRM